MALLLAHVAQCVRTRGDAVSRLAAYLTLLHLTGCFLAGGARDNWPETIIHS